MPTATTKEKKTKKKAKAKATVTKEAGGSKVKVTPAPKKTKAKAGKAAKKSDTAKSNKGPTKRMLLFQALEKNPNGLNCKALQEAIGGNGVNRITRDEMAAATPRIKAEKIEGVQGRTYLLTAAGRKALKDGTVDSNAPPAA